jgi:hypothetical protein
MRKSLVVAALVGALVLVMAPASMAASVMPVVVQGNPSCEGGLKIEPVVSGTFDGITITVTGDSFSFTTSGALVTTVIVKGGPNANVYNYPAPGVTGDTGLTAPINPNNNRPFGLSHLCFLTDGKKPPPPPKK